MINSLKKSFSSWSMFDYLWLIIANLTILLLSVYTNSSTLSIISAMTGITCTIFISKNMISNYLFGIVNVATYAYLAYSANLTGDFLLNLFYYLPMQFIGLYKWNKDKQTTKDNEDIKSLGTMGQVKLALGNIALIMIVAYFLKLTGDPQPIVDAATTILAVSAMLLMVFHYKEQWFIWIIVNSLSIFMWLVAYRAGTGDFATLLRWILYLANSLFGTYNWYKKLQN